MLPFEFKLTVLLILVAPYNDDPLYDVKSPPTNILPSDCKLITLTAPLKPSPIVNPVSFVPSEFYLVNLIADTPLYVVNWPPTNILPSDCSLKE